MSCGLMIGRFQPFHNGHLKLAHQILNECEELIIAVGSSQFNFTFLNPFTAGERIYFIHSSLVESKFELSRVYILPILNLENNAIWVQHLKSMLPKFDSIYSGNKFVQELLTHSSENFKVHTPKFYNKNECNGTNIRMNIVMNKKWRDFVPSAVCKIILEIGGVQRIKVLFETQKDGTGEIRQYPDVK
ncbi:MAG TPA: nicotinamide-nucleotide adenylyltransferase [Nitrososphaeraceae archaeon]|nr:nicotinamide-nucleotide adenylyltransferase [Nitrososphaeraceae archaeon]